MKRKLETAMASAMLIVATPFRCREYECLQALSAIVISEGRTRLVAAERTSGRKVRPILALIQRLGVLYNVEHGLAEIDNNLIENSMRPIALGRKNWMFAGSELGAKAAAIWYSLTESCRRLGLNPQTYLRVAFQRLRMNDPRDGDSIRALTPARLAAELAGR